MAGKRTRRPGQGFSLFDLQEDIASTVDSLGDALSRQGVAVDRDALLLSIQNVVQSIGNTGGGSVGGGNYGYPSLASDAEVPYSVAGDLLCMAHEYFQLGNKKEAVKNMLTAMESDDFNQISEGLLEMNRLSEKTNRAIFASEDNSSDDEDESTDDETENDEDEDENGEDDTSSEGDDLSDEDIDELIDDSEKDNETTANEGGSDNAMEHVEKKKEQDNSGSQDDEDEDGDEKDGDKDVPMGGTSSTIEASMTSKILANKISLQGDSKSRARATDFMKKNSRI